MSCVRMVTNDKTEENYKTGHEHVAHLQGRQFHFHIVIAADLHKLGRDLAVRVPGCPKCISRAGRTEPEQALGFEVDSL